jgi:hypothetical protein
MKKPHETKNIQGVFVNIAGESKKNKIETFLKKFIKTSEGKYSEELNGLIQRYKELYSEHQDGLNELAKIEELILQMSSRRDLDPVKYSTVKGLIYARTPFYRIGYKIKDIRVIVDEVKECEGMTKENLLSKSKKKLAESIDKVIFTRLIKYSEVHNETKINYEEERHSS